MSAKKYVPGTRIIDLTDHRFGALVAKSWFRGDDKNGNIFWHCIGDCGHTTEVVASALRNGDTKSCGRSGCKASLPRTNLIGENFGRLTVRSFVRANNGMPGRWECECSCSAGKTVLRSTNQLQSRAKEGMVQSCGCCRLPSCRDLSPGLRIRSGQ